LVFNVVMGSIIDTSRRYQLMSLRWSISASATASPSDTAGQYLGSNAPLKSYAVVICGASLFTVFAFLPARRYEVPIERRDTHAPPQSIAKALHQIVYYVRNYRAFRLFIICQAVFQSGLTMSVPLFPLHWIRVLHANDNIIGTVSMIQSVTLLIGYMGGSYIATRFKGRVVILWVCSIALGTYPLITALVGSMAPLVFLPLFRRSNSRYRIGTPRHASRQLSTRTSHRRHARLPTCHVYSESYCPSHRDIRTRASSTTIALIITAGLHFLAALFIFFKIGRNTIPN
jgi:positive regulator of sigma E activity